MTEIPSEIPILPELLKLGIKELIVLLKKSPGKFGKIIKERLIYLVKSKKYLISLSEEDTTELYKISKQELYKRLERCLVSHWSMNLIALGIYISKLNELDQGELAKKVKSEVHFKYQAKGLKILAMGSTGVIDHVIGFLSDIKTEKNYSFTEMGAIFDKIVERWDEITLFVKSEDSDSLIKKSCLSYLQKDERLFFVFAYGSAVKAAIMTIAELNNEGSLSGYLWDAKMKNIGQKEVYSCTFQSVKGAGIDMFV